MKKVLFFVEPHPLRNIFVEFITPGEIFATIASHKNFSEIDWRMFSNKFLLDLMVKKFEDDEKTIDFQYPHELKNPPISKVEALIEFKKRLFYPDLDDHNTICSYLNEWDDTEIESRNRLVDGEGELSSFYERLLEKVYQKYQFTHIVLWSENGAVRRFCQRFNIQTIHFEMGPTRRPFQETILIDPMGTNGNATLCHAINTTRQDIIDPELWMTNFSESDYISVQESYLVPSNANSVENSHGDIKIVTDKGYSDNVAAAISVKANFIDNYVVICLQLADDLNTLNHSEYADPKDFLQDIIPKIHELGYTVIIKRHPGAQGRVYNLVKEIEAIEYAKRISDNVFVLSSETDSEGFLALIKNSKAVISINSSASCESWILGIPGLILGKAAFDINDCIRKLSLDFIKGGGLINDDECITSIKKQIAFGLNYYFIPRNHYLLSRVLAKMVTEYTHESTAGYLEWLEKNIDIFDIMMEEKLLIMSDNISLDEKIDANELVKIAIPNDSFYSFSIDEFKVSSSQLSIIGWAAAEDASIIKVFIEYNNEFFFSDNIQRPDIDLMYSTVHAESGFIINEKINSNDAHKENLKIYIYGSDMKCRYINVVMD